MKHPFDPNTFRRAAAAFRKQLQNGRPSPTVEELTTAFRAGLESYHNSVHGPRCPRCKSYEHIDCGGG